MKIGIIKYLIVISVLFSSALLAAPDELAIEVSLDRDTIGLDEQAILTVTVSGANQNLPAPRLPTLIKFEVYSQGRSSSLSIVNGEINSKVTYRYILVPKSAGVYPIDQVATVYKNKRYKGNRVELTVLNKGSATSAVLEKRAKTDNGDTKDYFFEAKVDKKKPYVNEQVTLTLKFYLAVQNYGALDLAEPSTIGFWTEKIGNKAPYFQKINNRNYKIYEIKYALFPTQTGELEIGSAIIRATVASRNRKQNVDDIFGSFFGTGEDVTIRSNSIKINAKALPSKGKPDNFTGTIGNFEIKSKTSKREVEVNQPVSVTITVSGTGNIKSIAEPNLPESNEKFRIYKASSNESTSILNDKVSGTKIFEEIFIPKNPGEIEIPSIKYNFFNPKTGRYREIATQPIKIRAIKPEGYIASADIPYGSPDLTISSEARDIRYIKDKIGNTKNIGDIIITNPVYLIANGIPILVFFGMVFVRIRRERISGDIGYARSRIAIKEAKKRLTKAKSIADKSTAGEFYLEIYSAMTSYIADKLNISPHGLTTDKIKNLLENNNADAELTNEVINVLHESDYARFGLATVTQDDIDNSLNKAEKIMVKVYEIKFI
jgi:hypothetical protein